MPAIRTSTQAGARLHAGAWLLAAVILTGAGGCREADWGGGESAGPTAEQRYQAALTRCQQWAASCLYPGMSALFVSDWEAVYASPEFKMLVDNCMRGEGYGSTLPSP